MSENNKIEFSDDIKKLLAEKYPNVDIYNMPLDELKEFRETMEEFFKTIPHEFCQSSTFTSNICC